jgi:hypothetical protein
VEKPLANAGSAHAAGQTANGPPMRPFAEACFSQNWQSFFTTVATAAEQQLYVEVWGIVVGS